MMWNVIALTALIIGVVALVIAIMALVGLLAMKNSTHQISYIDPTQQNFSDFGKETKENLEKANNPFESIS